MTKEEKASGSPPPETGFIEGKSITVQYELPPIVELQPESTFFDTMSHNAPWLILCTGLLIWRSARRPSFPAWFKYLAWSLAFLGLFGLAADLIHFQSRSEWGFVHAPVDVMTWELNCLSILSPFLLLLQKQGLLKKILGLCLIALGISIAYFLASPLCEWIS